MSRLEKLKLRRTDDNIVEAKLLNEAYRDIAQSDSVKYVIGAMQPIDPEYTKNCYKQAERVRNQLENRLTDACEYKYQGSVTNDTHIKAKSDIDLLVIIDKFFTLENPQVPKSPYTGDPLKDLLNLRKESEDALDSAFPLAEVDKTGSKSISIEGGSLTRKVDVVPSNWYNTNKYAETGNDIYRGVQILDKSVPTRLANTPFLHNAWIDCKDANTVGGMRKACRLMKSLKYDSENIDLSSYDIVSIAFNIPDASLSYPKGGELQILSACLDYCQQLQLNSGLRESIEVPDKHRKIFSDGHATLQGLNQLTQELEQLADDVLLENQRSFRKLAEARVDY
ncbi:nucleotidyltransferase [Vibrio parahaemolyticus]|nr:nucleotidyltransferase [Vibrio parahaemolyticus]